MSPSRGGARPGRLRAAGSRVVLGMLRHAGDWAVSPRAMTALAHELPARQPGWSLEVRAMPVRATERALFDCALVYLTGRRDPRIEGPALARLGRYLDRGGFLWVDDGAPPGDDTFGRAARRLLAKVLPGASLRRVRLSHPLFSSAYELARGYLGRSVPAGAWARHCEIEGLFAAGGRLVAVYTRNGYGRAMELDPTREPSFRPPVGLTPREAREGALRVGTNIAVHVLRSAGEALPGDPAREEFDPARRYRYRGRALDVDRGAFDPAAWRPMREGAPVRVSAAGATLALDITSSERDRAGATRKIGGPRMAGLVRGRAVVFDLRLGSSSPARVALRFRASGGEVYESTPLYVRTGLNADLRVPLDGADFRATATGFRKYDAPLDTTKAMSAFSVILYGKDLGGRVELSRLRVEGWGAR